MQIIIHTLVKKTEQLSWVNMFKCGGVRLIKILARGFIAVFVLFSIVFLSAQASCAI